MPPKLRQVAARLDCVRSECAALLQRPARPILRTRVCLRSIKEPGLYDYIIFNEEVEEAFRQLASVAERALRGQARIARRGGEFWLYLSLPARDFGRGGRRATCAVRINACTTWDQG